MLANLQKTLLDRTAVAAADAVPPIPEFTADEATVWCQTVGNHIQSCCLTGESTAIFKFTKGYASIWYASPDGEYHDFSGIPKLPRPESESDTAKEATWRVQVVPMPLRRWWHSLDLNLNQEAKQLAVKRRDDLLLAYLAYLLNVWHQHSDVPASIYHDKGKVGYSFDSSKPQYLGLKFDWSITPDRLPILELARTKVLKRERQLREAIEEHDQAVQASAKRLK